MHSPTAGFSIEQRELWTRVEELWAMAKSRAERQIMAALHPDYVGWDMSSPQPHDRDVGPRAVELAPLPELDRQRFRHALLAFLS